ncbi:MAG: hypothetical protein WCP36_10440, partial [Methanomicrobiales archaeon]
ASILVYSDDARDTLLNFSAFSFEKERNISILVNNQGIGSYQIPSNFVNVSVPIRINQGMNSLNIVNSDGCERPADTASLNNIDPRCLSIAIQNVTLM